MQLFSDNGFFMWLALLALPAIFLGVREKPLKHYGMAVSLVFLWLALGHNLRALAYLTGFCLFEYALVCVYGKARLTQGRKAGTYYTALVLSIAPLTLYKILSVTGNPHHILGFLGISYMTFKAVQIVIEIYDGLIERVPADEFFYLMLFFPVLVSGPIDRSRRFHDDLVRTIPREEYLEMVGEGLMKIFKGLVYKLVLAACFYALMQYFGMGRDGRSVLIYLYSYGFYLFFDFAGYSLMAVGASNLFGIRTPDNFNNPFRSKDIIEFWDRWHITLSHWFRDYVFSRVTMALVKGRRIKNKLAIAAIAFLINMGLMGFWHGLELHFIAYGLYHGVLLAAFEVFRKKSRFYKKHKKDRWFILLSWFITFHLVMFGFFIFSGRLTALIK